MKIVKDFPRRVREIENLFIPLSDGCRLAARVWLPEDAGRDPVPAIVEYIPYRKRDGTVERDQIMHPYFAGHGYAVLRIDLRGSGESDGILRDEYLKQEQDDCLEALRWIAAQPWCSGAVGMMGISWGGFNALQVAARRPPELKAVITACSTDDRYADDVHYMGGCLLLENAAWAAAMFCYASPPPDPVLVGEDRWRAMWLERLENMPLWLENWLSHQRRDAYWRHGSVCENYADIQCPVYAVGGWADGYSNAVPRLLANLQVPRKGLIGPWSHAWPHSGEPGPAIGFLQECLRWWDRWLKGIETGIMDEPIYRVWMQEWVPPRAFHAERPGRWVAEPAWPSPSIETKRLVLNPGRLDDRPGAEVVLTHRSPQSVGQAAGTWCPYATGTDLDDEQREDDALSLTFDSAPLEERLEILGAPAVELELSVDQPVALVAVRLCDVDPLGSSLRVTYGVLNLTHRDGHAEPQPLEPGTRYRIRVPLNDIAHAFPRGHRIRIAVSTSYWPLVWPAPRPVTLTLFAGASHLDLPVRPPRTEDAALPPFPGPEGAPPLAVTVLQPPERGRRVRYGLATGEHRMTVLNHDGERRIDALDLTGGSWNVERYRIRADDPLSARAAFDWTMTMGRGVWRVRTETRTVLTCTADRFRMRLDLDAYERDAEGAERRVFCRSWEREIARDLV